eukprot:11045720-Alexandrium_andersonii.AAC.1
MRSPTADAAPSESARWSVSTPTTRPASVDSWSPCRACCSCSWFTARATSARYSTTPGRNPGAGSI